MRLEAHFYIWSQDVKDLSDLIQKVEEWENIWIQVQKAKPSPLDTAVLNAIEKASYNRE
jgi:tRNA A37 methylthiotransferase MiaB